MNDDEGGKVIRSTDLSREVDTDRAVLHYQLVEKAIIKANKSGFEVSSESSPGSPQNKALTMLYLAIAVCAITAVAVGIGIPAAAALITGLGATTGLYLLVHFTSERRARQ